MRTLNDIYQCAQCKAVVAHGNRHCRGCGVRFTAADIDQMKNNIQSVVGALPWNLRDVYRCVHCHEHIAIVDAYCRGCGDEICDNERQLMKLRMDEIAKQNTPALIGLHTFVLLVILALVAM
ncbi:double zinc ribbon domain-containing protein [Gilvimarinus chinensis]|uniref:double zinc ribbon domain-containing protein n=1 Tax=Gilvimarinus chinensis TaxID=396005 RepID=UPI000A00A73A|nr:zinc ribbon domain-containing protein [Gilvimarinus chinensis]